MAIEGQHRLYFYLHSGSVHRGVISWSVLRSGLEEDHMAKLTTKARKKLPKKDFALPATKDYPIEDKNHARAALSRSSGKPVAAKVRKAVQKKYPSMGKKRGK